jgi:single-strand DNA-binding protein
MYRLKNRVQLIGNLCEEPIISTSDKGKKTAKLRLATSESYRNAFGEKVTEVQWHHLIAWGKVAEIAEKYLCKGKEVAIEGKLVNHIYTDKNGDKRHITEVQVTELLLLNNAISFLRTVGTSGG